MPNCSRPVRLLVLIGFTSSLAWAADPATNTPPSDMATSAAHGAATPNKPKGDPYRWLTQEQITALVATIPPPPAAGSPEEKTDLDIEVAAQNARTLAIEAECKRFQKYSPEFFEPLYRAEVPAAAAPEVEQIVRDVVAFTGKLNGEGKDKYKRLRPYLGHPELIHALFTVNGYSYPSGHSMGSFTLATVLGGIFPDKAQAFLDLAGRVAQSRVNAGVHYTTDIKEGEVLGKAAGAEILASPAFQKDLADLKAKLKP